MAVSSLQNKSFPTQANLLKTLSLAYPGIVFKPGTNFAWSPKLQTITYVIDKANEPTHAYALLHEVAHAKLAHNTFTDDFNLLQLEVAAWEQAKQIGLSVDIPIDEDHVQDCLDTYRDWLHARAQCPTCGVVSLQAKDGSYTCFNCKTGWKVPKSQLCRVRRTKI